MPETATAAPTADLSQLSDLELVDRSLQGTKREREEAFRTLYRRRNPGLRNWLEAQHGLDSDAAADVAAETWSRAFRHLHRFDRRESKFRSWLWFIARNLTRNVYRNRSRDPQILETVLDGRDPERSDRSFFDQTAAESGPENFTVTPVRSPAESFEGAEVVRIVWDAIDDLPQHQRVVAKLRAKGLSYKEMEEATGIKVGTVKSRLFRARDSLKQKLSNEIDLSCYLKMNGEDGGT